MFIIILKASVKFPVKYIKFSSVFILSSTKLFCKNKTTPQPSKNHNILLITSDVYDNKVFPSSKLMVPFSKYCHKREHIQVKHKKTSKKSCHIRNKPNTKYIVHFSISRKSFNLMLDSTKQIAILVWYSCELIK